MQQVRETGTRPNMGGRVAVFVSFPVWRPRARIPRANQPIWPRMHSLIPAGFSDTCQRAIFSLSQWERQEPGSNPQLKRLEQNNSAGDHRPWACVFALLCSVSVYAQIVNRVFDWVVVVLVELVCVCMCFFFYELLAPAAVWRPRRPPACEQQILKGLLAEQLSGALLENKSPLVFPPWVCWGNAL